MKAGAKGGKEKWDGKRDARSGKGMSREGEKGGGLERWESKYIHISANSTPKSKII